MAREITAGAKSQQRIAKILAEGMDEKGYGGLGIPKVVSASRAIP